VINNTVNGKPFVYWESIIGGTIPSDAGQVILVNCTDVTIKDQILDKSSFGIIVDFSSNITLFNNTVKNGEYGIFLAHSDNNTLIKYTGYNNKKTDINFFGKCNNNILSNNTIGYNAEFGMSINWDSKNNTIVNNTVFNTKEGGIRVIDSENNTISHNIISYNQKYGIRLRDTSSNIIVEFNDFNKNNIGGSQASDNGSNNVFGSNYWNDWTGIGPYAIDGLVGNQDLSPLTNPYHLSAPVIMYPTSGTLTLKNNVNIQWTASSDLWGHHITYLVYYSSDSGTTWTQLASYLLKTNYEWDTNSVPDGSSFMVKVVAVCSLGLNAYTLSTDPITIDNTPPLMTIDSPLTQTYTTDTITIRLSSDDAVNYWFYIESVDTQNQTWTDDVTRTLTDGAYTLNAYGNDSAGNIAHEPVTFTIDNTPPEVVINSPLSQTYITETITVTLSGDAAYYWYYIESVDSQNQTWTTSVDRTLVDGTYSLHVYGNDSVGNVAHASVTFTISTSIPTTTSTTTTSTTTTTTTRDTPGFSILMLLIFGPYLIYTRRRKSV
jgi:parallel beta-helix repeat protein